MRPGGRLQIDYQGAGPWPEGRGHCRPVGRGLGALIIGARRLPRNLGRVANALCLEALRGHWPRRATRTNRVCFALGLRGCGRQFGAGNLRRGPITEAWARRGRCLPLAALTGASDAQETGPGEAKRDFPGL